MTERASQQETWRILHIDDDEEDHLLVRLMLSEAQGRRVELDYARNAEEARRLVSQNRYDALLVDYDLGAETGIQLIRDLAQQNYPAALILLTGRGSYEVDVEAMHAGATLYLTKNEVNALLLERFIRYAIERKQAEAQRELSEHKLAIIFERSPMPTFLVDYQHRRFVDVNQAYLEMFGFRKEELVGKPMAELNMIRDAEFLDVLEAELARSGHVKGYEGALHTRSGEVRLTAANMELIEINGKLYILGTVLDVTERKHTEQALEDTNAALRASRQTSRESAERFQEVLEASLDAIYRRDLQQDRYDYLSPVVEQILGFSVGEMEQMSMDEVLDRIHPDDREAIRSQLEQASEQGKGRLRYRFRHKDGRYRWLADHVTVTKDDGGRDLYRTGSIRDITEQVQSMEAIRISEERFSKAFLASPDAIAISCMADGKLVEVNERFEQLFGYSREELLGKSSLELSMFVYPEERQKAVEIVRQQGYLRDYEVTIRIRSGEARPVALSIEMIDLNDEDNMLTIIRDLTEQKRSEAWLRESEASYRQLAEALEVERAKLAAAIETLPIGMGIGDNQGNTLTLNAAGLRMHGFQSEAEMFSRLDRYVEEFELRYLDGRVMPLEEWPVSRALRGEFVRDYQLCLINRMAGEEHILTYSVAPVRNSAGEIILVVYVMQDITERMQAEADLRASEQRFRQLAESMPQLVWTAEPDGQVDYYNQRYRLYGGIEPGEGDYWSWGPVLHPDDLQQTVAAWSEAVRSAKIYQAEHRVRMADGSYRWHLSRGNPVFDERGQLVKWYGTATDIHETKMAQAALVEFADKLQRSNEELENFAFVASHDMQEPLRKIQLFGNILRKQAADNLNPDAQDTLARMQNAADRMQTMIHALLDLSRVNTRGRSFARVDFNRVAREVVSDLEARLQASGGQIQLGELPDVEGDAFQMQQLLQNLLANALKFQRPGVAPVVRVTGKLTGTDASRRVVITVEDNGIGFDTSQAERLFQPFVRLHGRSEYEGTGMGLAICRRIVERHGGSITASGQPGAGATFTVTLPAAQEDQEGPA